MKQFKQLMLLGTVLCTMALSIPSTALAITYDVNRVIGGGGVTGTIETDGTLGVLATGNIVDWNLVLDDGVGTFNLLGPLSGNNSGLGLLGSSLTANASNILFDFSGIGGIVDFQNPNVGSGINYWCFDDTSGLPCLTGSSSSESLRLSALNTTINHSGLQVIATVNPVPEPSTILLLGSGLVGLVAWKKRRSQA